MIGRLRSDGRVAELDIDRFHVERKLTRHGLDRFARDTNELVGAHKTPTLRNVADTSPYMHAGQINTLEQVLTHYNEAPVSILSHNEAKPLGLRQSELQSLHA